MTTTHNTKEQKEQKEHKQVDPEFSVKDIANYLLPFAFIAGLVAWYRNNESGIIMRVIYVLFAYMLNIVYLAYMLYKAFAGGTSAPAVPASKAA
jgi:hypothetical protein